MDRPPQRGVLLAAFAPLFSHCLGTKVQARAVGALLATGPRTVWAVLRILGQSRDRPFLNSHRVLNRDAWSGLGAGQILLGRILALIPGDGPLVLAPDDTRERRGGRRIRARGCYRDAVRWSRGHLVRCFGRKWIVLTVLVPVPGSQRVWAVPLLTTWSWPEGAGRRSRPKTSLDGTRPRIRQVRRGLPEPELIRGLEGGLAAVKLARDCPRPQGALICRLRLEAALDDPPGSPPPSQRGPPPKKGPRPRRLSEWAGDAATPWEAIAVDGYDGQRKSRRVFTGPGRWSTRGQDPVAIRYVLARDPGGALSEAASLGREERFRPEEILKSVGPRWRVEVTFEEAGVPLGWETQRQGSDLAIQRTTPVLLGLFTLVTLRAVEGPPAGLLEAERTAWSEKECPTFSDWMRRVRQQIWRSRITGPSSGKAEVLPGPLPLLEALVHGLSSAA
ncbi:MAG TPA: hypothetical protein VKP69_22565 [Isosphaeraceae bacterium]|nr:hypothetical protein [Isosphaeraceae bacterium]